MPVKSHEKEFEAALDKETIKRLDRKGAGVIWLIPEQYKPSNRIR
jgi:hypothetical protein